MMTQVELYKYLKKRHPHIRDEDAQLLSRVATKIKRNKQGVTFSVPNWFGQAKDNGEAFFKGI